MAKMMRRNNWVIVEAYEEIEEDRKIRALWAYLYGLYSAERADKILDGYVLPRPPSRTCRTPE